MFRNIFSFTTLCLVFTWISIPGSGFAGDAAYFNNLERQLIQEGFDRVWIMRLYDDPRVDFEMRGVSRYFVHSEGSLNYDQFKEPAAIQKAQDYLKFYEGPLFRAERRHGVDREVIVAIALVETRLGTYIGIRSVFNTLSTMAALSDQKVLAALWQYVEAETRMDSAAFREKARQKSAWAYNELTAFLRYVGQENIDPLSIKGSYAGAMGICQFIPSNIKPLARDGSGDGRVDLFNHADAIMSIANYLRHYGWRPGISARQAYDVVYTYNHSGYYVNAVLDIYRILKAPL